MFLALAYMIARFVLDAGRAGRRTGECAVAWSRARRRATGANGARNTGVHGREVIGEDPVGLSGQKLTPGQAAALRGGIGPGVVQDLPHGRIRDLVAQPGRFAVDPAAPPPRVPPGHRHHQPPVRRRC